MNYLVELRKALEDKLKEADGKITHGSPADFAEYRFLVGVRGGLEHAAVEVAEMIERLARNEDSE